MALPNEPHSRASANVATAALAHESSGQGPLLVLVHGLTESRASWDPVVAELETDHRVLRVDLRGHGDSPRTATYEPHEMAGDISALAAGPPLIVGHSLGGLVATAYAAMFPTRGVINIECGLDFSKMQAVAREIAPALRGPRYAEVATSMFESIRGQLPDDAAQRLNKIRRLDRDIMLGVWSSMMELDDAQYAEIVRGWTAAIDVPYLALDGKDPGPGYRAWLYEQIPQAELEVWDGLGHWPHLVYPRRFAQRLRNFEASASRSSGVPGANKAGERPVVVRRSPRSTARVPSNTPTDAAE